MGPRTTAVARENSEGLALRPPARPFGEPVRTLRPRRRHILGSHSDPQHSRGLAQQDGGRPARKTRALARNGHRTFCYRAIAVARKKDTEGRTCQGKPCPWPEKAGMRQTGTFSNSHKLGPSLWESGSQPQPGDPHKGHDSDTTIPIVSCPAHLATTANT